MAIDIKKLDKAVTPFLETLGDLFFRDVTEAKRHNLGPADDAQTETDLAVEAHVVAFLKSISDFPVLSEESAKTDDARDVFLNAAAYWICDPIDGTTFFQKLEYGEFATLLSLVEDGEIVAAWAYFPGATAAEDVLAKSITPDTVTINDVPSVVASQTHKTHADYIGRFGISKNDYAVTADERAQFEKNKTDCGMTKHPRRPGHGHLKFARGQMDYFAHIGSHPWDYTVLAKFVTALGGQAYKFDAARGPCLYQDDVILDAEMVVAVTLPGIDYNAAIAPLFAGTRWEKTCLLPPAM